MLEKRAERKQECVQVVVRCRPLNTKDKHENRGKITVMETSLLQVAISNPARPTQAPKPFTFDAVYDETTQQKNFYEESCYDLVEGVMEGYNGTIFAYGQTGCGKTFTMQGRNDPPELRGVIPLSFDHIFENIKGSVTTTFLVRCSYLEIYNEEVRDLLATSKGKKRETLELREDPNKGVYIKDLTQAIVNSQEGTNRLMEDGQKVRTVGTTAMNEKSSRSHSIFTVVVEINDTDGAGKDHIRVGKLNLVDLAGSERATKTRATGDRLKEGCKINLSLSALGNVISALADGKGKHIPYRDSKLTRLLQDSLGGNTKTLMVAAISPADYNYEETLSTLRYANRAKNIKNKPKINEDPKDTTLRQYKEEIDQLKKQLAQVFLTNSAGASPTINTAPISPSVETSLPAPERDSRPPHDMIPSQGNYSNRKCQQTACSTSQGELEVDPLSTDVNMASGSLASESAAIDVGQPAEIENNLRAVSLGEGKAIVGGNAETVSDTGLRSGEGERRRRQIDGTIVQEGKVDSKSLENQKKALENYRKAMEEQRNRLGQELETSVLHADVERRARDEVARKLEALQQKIIGLSSRQDRRRQRRASAMVTGGVKVVDRSVDIGGDAGETFPEDPVAPENEDPEVILARRNAEHRRMQARLRHKRKKEAHLELERVRALEEKAEVEKEMADVVGQAEEKERRLNRSRKKLERKLVEAREEVEDLTMENEREREELLDTIRNQNRELQLWEQVARQLLTSKEIARIWERGEYNENEQAWVLPRIRPRPSYAGNPYKLPLLGPLGEGIDDDANSPTSGRDGGGRKDPGKRVRGRSGNGDAERDHIGIAAESGGDVRGTCVGGEDGDGRRRRIPGNVDGSNNYPHAQRAGDELLSKERDGDDHLESGGMFNCEKSWELRGGRGGKNGDTDMVADPWNLVISPMNNIYKGLTPSIGPPTGHLFLSPSQTQTSHGVSGQGQQQRSCPRVHHRKGSGAEEWDPNRPSSRRGSRIFSRDMDDGSRAASGDFDFPSQESCDGESVGGDCREDNIPSILGASRTGSGVSTSGSRIRQGGDGASFNEDYLLCQGDKTDFSHVGGSKALRSEGDLSTETERIGDRGAASRARVKSRRRKTRSSLGTGGRVALDEHGAVADWGNDNNERKPATVGGGEQERRLKSGTRGYGGDGVDRVEGDAASASYPSLLYSGQHWGEEREDPSSRSPATGGGLFDLRC